MKIFNNAQQFFEYTKSLEGEIGFVPTMGALHEGHISLINRAKSENKHCLVSIFVNPTQFLPTEYLSKYPRREDADIKICKLSGVDAIFMPSIAEIYAPHEPSIVSDAVTGYVLEGERRPGHFDGVLTVVMKLLNISRAARAYFGQKDAQQLLQIKQMAKAFFMDTIIIECPTVREKDGLAMSSRNIYLSAEQRKEALKISKSLFVAGSLIGKGELCSSLLEDAMRSELKGLDIEYVAFCNRELKSVEKIELSNSIILIACRIGATRLIDNLWV